MKPELIGVFIFREDTSVVSAHADAKPRTQPKVNAATRLQGKVRGSLAFS